MQRERYLLAKSRNLFLCGVRKIVSREHFRRTRYYGQRIMECDETNDWIRKRLQSGEPFLVSRFGDAELRAVMFYLENELHLREGFPEKIKTVMHRNAGFFPATDENLMRYGKMMLDAAAQVDLFAVWYNLMEDYVIHTYGNAERIAHLEAIEPYLSKNPWSSALKGKKVLVVHPFSDSIEKQYRVRDQLFSDPCVLPDFQLLTYRTVQTNAGGETHYSDWFAALEGMFSEIRDLHFDVAIVGCGSYGMPLAAGIKGLGKQVIHLAGATQILFGIRGARWDARPYMQKFFNENWIRPSAAERPKNADLVEGACYW